MEGLVNDPVSEEPIGCVSKRRSRSNRQTRQRYSEALIQLDESPDVAIAAVEEDIRQLWQTMLSYTLYLSRANDLISSVSSNKSIRITLTSLFPRNWTTTLLKDHAAGRWVHTTSALTLLFGVVPVLWKPLLSIQSSVVEIKPICLPPDSRNKPRWLSRLSGQIDMKSKADICIFRARIRCRTP